MLLFLPYLVLISLQTINKLQEALKNVLDCFKLAIVLKCQRRPSNPFCYKDPIPKDLISDVVYKSQRDLHNETYSDKSMRKFDIRSGEHIDVPPLTGRKTKPSNKH